MHCDYVLSYEEKQYGWQHPVGIVSWPTLDSKEHDSEWNSQGKKSLEYNDAVSIDMNHINTKDNLETGFFGAYHIYPNYPDFMNNEVSYADYEDEQGTFRYGGYLKEFMESHRKYPALVAEFGLSTGMGNAHDNPEGYHHGGLTEVDQGNGIVRMMKAVKKEGYAGGLIFEWTDEWAKKTWITEPYIIPFERNSIWHNAVDPEQNYGIYGMESNGFQSDEYVIKEKKGIKQLSMSADETFLHIEITLDKQIDFSKDKLLIGLATYDRTKGEYKYAKDLEIKSSTGLEYLIEINSKDAANLLVHPGYNTTNGSYASYASTEGIFERMYYVTNKQRITKDRSIIPAKIQNLSRLKYGSLDNNSYYNWCIKEDTIFIRIPWTRINVTDPSSMTVLDDQRNVEDPKVNELKTVVTEGILASGILIGKENKNVLGSIGLYNDQPFTWNTWDVPSFKARRKDSYVIIKEYLKELK
jgi:hypothetical protein